MHGRKRGRPMKRKLPEMVGSCGLEIPRTYTAYTILKKEKSGGLYFMRKITIVGTMIVREEDDVEDLYSRTY